jgi:hypothetical protein
MRVLVAAALTSALALFAAACTSTGTHSADRPHASGSSSTTDGAGRPTPTSTPSPNPTPWSHALHGRHKVGHLAPGSDPSVLPGDLLIADKLNNRLLIVDPQGRVRWRFPRPGDLRHGQTFKIPDDAFFTPDGRHIITTEEDDFVIRVIDIAQHRIVYSYGKPGVPGDGPNRLWNPDDAVMLPNRSILTADIKNQRILLIGKGQHHPKRHWGDVNHGLHDPPHFYGAPNGVFPIGHHRFLVTEIRGDWVDKIDLHGHVYWSSHPPGVLYPSDSNRIGRNRFLTVDYSSPGQIAIFNRHGHVLWRYAPSGSWALDHPSLALPLPNGDVVCNDDYNHRVIVVDPHTNEIVWQYGHTGVSGRKAGYLDNPDGLDVAPPYSLADRRLR